MQCRTPISIDHHSDGSLSCQKTYLFAFSYEPQEAPFLAVLRADLGTPVGRTPPAGAAPVAARLALYASLIRHGAKAPPGAPSADAAATLAKRILLAWADRGFRNEQGGPRSLASFDCDDNGKPYFAADAQTGLALSLGRGAIYAVQAQDLLTSLGVLDADELRRLGRFQRMLFELIRLSANKFDAVPHLTIDWYFEELGWPERTAAYLDGACKLFIDAAGRCLDAAGLAAADVDTVVTVSSTGIATPSLEARVAGHMGFRSDVERVPVFGLGCAGGVSGLAIASKLAKSSPGSVVLLVVVELCTLSFRLDELTKSNIVATALFGDGAAACVLKAGEVGLAEVEMSGQHMWPDTLDIMGWSVDREGFGVIFDRAIPPFAEANMNAAVSSILGQADLTLDDIDRFAFHPGGTKVVNALERAFALGQGTLDHERGVLADYGNMSAPTALFVLDRVIQSGLPSRTLLTAMGPGFSTSCVSLKCAA